jgi:inorganic pyrophosphatase
MKSSSSFPYNFGFIPSTRGEDGDPLDVLMLMDEPAFANCLVAARLIGVIEAEQYEDGKTMRNDRLTAVAVESRDHRGVDDLGQIHPNLLHEIEAFFVYYTAAEGKAFKPLGRAGPQRARELVKDGMKVAQAATKK